MDYFVFNVENINIYNNIIFDLRLKTILVAEEIFRGLTIIYSLIFLDGFHNMNNTTYFGFFIQNRIRQGCQNYF